MARKTRELSLVRPCVTLRTEDVPKEHCGVIGIRSYSGKNVTRLTLQGMERLQNRGQGSFGISVQDSGLRKMHGLVGEGLDKDPDIVEMVGGSAIGHLRYATVGDEKDLSNFHPIQINASIRFRIAHNGTISTTELREELQRRGVELPAGRTDTELAGYLLAELYDETRDWVRTFAKFSEIKVGSFCFMIHMENGDIIGARDERGYKPMCYGYHPGSDSYVIASEDPAIRQIGAELISDVPPGHIIILGGRKRSPELYSFVSAPVMALALDPFEINYFMRPDSTIFDGAFKGMSVAGARIRLGRALFEKFGGLGDVVVPVPDSALFSAEGYSETSGIRLTHAIRKDRYKNRRSFIEKETKRKSVAAGIIVIPDLVRGRRLVVIDDSIVRGTSSEIYLMKLKEAGAESISLLSTFPPLQFPCRMGIDFPSHEELIAYRVNNGGSISEVGSRVAHALGIKFVGYLDPESFSRAVGIPLENFCFACVTNDYSKLWRGANEKLVQLVRA